MLSLRQCSTYMKAPAGLDRQVAGVAAPGPDVLGGRHAARRAVDGEEGDRVVQPVEGVDDAPVIRDVHL